MKTDTEIWIDKMLAAAIQTYVLGSIDVETYEEWVWDILHGKVPNAPSVRMWSGTIVYANGRRVKMAVASGHAD